MSKSTAVLHDSNLSGGVVIAVEDQTAEEFAEYVADRSGLWTYFDTEDGGAILLSEGWFIDFFADCEFDQAVFDAGETGGRVPDVTYEGYWDEEKNEDSYRVVE